MEIKFEIESRNNRNFPLESRLPDTVDAKFEVNEQLIFLFWFRARNQKRFSEQKMIARIKAAFKLETM